MHRIAIVGGGAGGLELATRLGDTLGRSGLARVTLIDKNPTHIWKPLLHEVAAGTLDTETHVLDYTAQAHWHFFDFVRGEMVALDRKTRTLSIGAVVGGDNFDEEVLPPRIQLYDTLVLAVGSSTHFFGIPGADIHSVPLDTVDQAERLRRRLLQFCMRRTDASQAGNPEQVNVAIIGGGATGVELSAELLRMEKGFRKFGLRLGGNDSCFRVTLMEAGPRILPAISERVAATTARLLEKLGVSVLVGDAVTKVEQHAVVTKSGQRHDADITIWAAGIKAPDFLSSLDGLEVNRINQVKVNSELQAEHDASVYALGDCCSCVWTEQTFVPPRAQAAHQQAKYLAKSLQARLAGRAVKHFRYIDHGSLVSLGSISAVGSLMGGIIGRDILVEGLLARLMYASLYRKHIAAVSGVRRMVFSVCAQLLRRAAAPRVKLH
ncbi:NAD(P)/FAD-dependent oxidoreductase [Paraburkholderia rhynchosiae]|uniref:FAD-dependent oxidoreductase n=1 Tax=Paraburkholderia rhynchosiae TaxID=487049 RepID=A0A2N7WH72_9BURK|nr:NAD(P)/FAD-dependent oxidoreductase [Paraburkholderia rhynchosiae]PMS28819.1 FAD-dependent oxidoreductase [Paraburkholderia rhynchosiae]CAB3655923.1 NADH dehydrogenase [Paraburkholderia rhynchosiae]